MAGVVDAAGVCPGCAAPVTVTPGFVMWCEQCDWNVNGSHEAATAASLEARISARAGRRQFKRLIDGQQIQTSRSWQRILATVFATFVVLVPVILTVGCLAWFMIAPNVLAAVGLLIAVSLLVLIRPRPFRVMRHQVRLDRTEAPALYGLLDEIAAVLHARPIDAVVLDPLPNAAFVRTRFGRRRFLVIGVSLMGALSSQQRVALLGHEMAHDVNGDGRNGFLVETSLRTMFALHASLPTRDGARTTGEVVGAVLCGPLRWALRGALWVELALLGQSSQNAEYLADRLAAQIASKPATVELLDVVLLSEAISRALAREVTSRGTRDPLEVARAFVADVPAAEWRRLRRASALQEHQIDRSHPPTALRRDLVAAMPGGEVAAVACDEARSLMIDSELRTYAQACRTLVQDAVKAGWVA